MQDWNARPKRDMLRHVMRTGGFAAVYTYKELYGGRRLSRLADVALAGRLHDVTDVVMEAKYDVQLHYEDYWLVRTPLPARLLADDELAEEDSSQAAGAARGGRSYAQRARGG